MFTHLHLHTEYSLLDGACRIEQLLDKAVAQNMKSVAITDHGVMYGAVNFYKAAIKRGIKPIIGCEVYVAPRTRFDKTHELDSNYHHLVLLCKDNEGYQNLIAMVSKSWTEGFYIKPRIDIDLLREHSKGLIALSACLAGEIPSKLMAGKYQEAKNIALCYSQIMGKNNFYIELQDHGLQQQKKINPMLIKLSEETGLPLVVTNDCHYIEKQDSDMHNVLLCIQTNHTLDEPNPMAFSTNEFYFKSEEEMRSLFPDYQEAADNTNKIADRCNVTFTFGQTKLPRFDTPNGQNNFEYFREKCYQGLINHYGKNPSKEIQERLDYELNTINKMGYVNYYLIVHDFVRHAKEAGIPVGPGRGSGAGSLAAYCIGITGIDPIQYDLLFERFLNPERVSMPDFDIDFSDERRSEMIDYVVQKYGEDHVAQIVTFGTMAAKGAIRDVGRVMGLSYAYVDSVSKLVPNKLNITIELALKISPELNQKYQNDEKIHELIDMAKKVEGMPRNTSTHAAGVVITDKPIAEYVPLAKNGDSVVCQYTMTVLEELGLLKMDFLGLRNLSIISEAENLIRKNIPDFNINKISVNEPNVYKMLSSGATDGVFQFESGGIRNVLIQLRPEKLEDLIAVTSLYRPGPMDSIPKYIENRHHPEKITYAHPLLKSILNVTNGCIVYQEQVMQIFRTLAGYSLGRADIVRRAMSKKKHDVMQKEREIFINGLVREDGTVEVAGCLRNGVSKEVAESIYSEMESFASYAFNKSHAAAYGYLAYQTAYLKCFYPKEYMAALLTSVLENTNKLAGYIAECSRLKIKILPPQINHSFAGFTVEGQNIRFGLLAVKSIGRGVINSIIDDREINGNFTSFYQFCKRMFKSVNRRAIENFIKCGAFDSMGTNRRQMLVSVEEIISSLETDSRKNVDGQIGFFDISDRNNKGASEYNYPEISDFNINDILAQEKEVMGIYISGHPMAQYKNLAKCLKTININRIIDSVSENDNFIKDGDTVNLLGIITHVQIKITKANEKMAFVTFEDYYGSVNVIVFPRTLSQNATMVEEGRIIHLFARVNARDDEDLKLIWDHAETVEECENKYKNNINSHNHIKNGLYLKVKSKSDPDWIQAKKYLNIFDGTIPLYVAFIKENKLYRAPASEAVDVNEPLIKELKNILGEKNVAFVTK